MTEDDYVGFSRFKPLLNSLLDSETGTCAVGHAYPFSLYLDFEAFGILFCYIVGIHVTMNGFKRRKTLQIPDNAQFHDVTGMKDQVAFSTDLIYPAGDRPQPCGYMSV